MKLAHVQGLKGEESVQHFMAAVVVALSILAGSLPGPARAQTIIDEWASAKLPAPPDLKPVTIDPKETALLVMDFTVQTCTPQRRLRCANSVPKVEKLVADARRTGAFVIYSVAVPGSTAADILKELTPAAGEPVLPPLGPDKFVGSELDKMLKERGIKTVIAIGTQAHTSVLHTGSAAALRGFKVVVPVDGMSGDDPWPELYTAWHLANAARISAQVTLTRMDMIKF
jgi:nicotinamidase-related amidase